jgi:hypothetical protein
MNSIPPAVTSSEEQSASNGGSNGKLSKELFAQLKAKHGEMLQMSTDVGVLLFERPSQAIWDRWIESCADDTKSKTVAMRMLCLGSLVYPPQEQAEAIFAKYPGIPSAVTNKLMHFVGAGDRFEIKNV